MPEPFIWTKDDTLPGLYIPAPKCDHCFQDVQIEDDYAFCQQCLVVWPSLDEDAPAEPDPDREGADVPCGSTDIATVLRADYVYQGSRYQRGEFQPCILPSGHEGEHRCPIDITVTPLETP